MEGGALGCHVNASRGVTSLHAAPTKNPRLKPATMGPSLTEKRGKLLLTSVSYLYKKIRDLEMFPRLSLLLRWFLIMQDFCAARACTCDFEYKYNAISETLDTAHRRHIQSLC